MVRSYSPVTTIGGGRVAEPGAPRRKRLSDKESHALDAVLADNATDAINARAVLSGWAGETPGRMAVTTPWPPEHLLATIPATGHRVERDGRLYHRDRLDQARRILLEAVDRHHEREPLSPGVRLEHLRQALPSAAPQALIESIIAALEQDGSLAVDGNRARRADYQPRLEPAQERAASAILDEFARAGLAAPAPQELSPPLATRTDLDDLLHHLVRHHQLVALGGRRFLSPAALADAIRHARQTFGGRADLTPGDFRDLFGISRKYLIPVLEYFDRTGVTVREGEGRRMATPPHPGGDLTGSTP